MPLGNLLIVDDVAENRDLLSRRLKKRGYTTAVAASGEAALAQLANARFDMVLLDVQMPGLSGLEVLVKIRETLSKSELPVVMVSAQTESTEVVRALQLGANDYITKPIDFPIALARIEAQLALRAEVREQIKKEVIIRRTEDLARGFLLDERYRIQESLGEGGFAVVYRATQLETGQDVAVKLLRADRVLEDKRGSTEVVRFEQEMRLIGKIKHPNIVRLYDSGRIRVSYERKSTGPLEMAIGDDNTRNVKDRQRPTGPMPAQQLEAETSLPYIVMEYLEGETLHDLLEREGTLPIELAVDLVLPVISALSVAHAHEVVHRDLKPHNLFLVQVPGGRLSPRVLDFGVAKFVGDGVDDLTKTASILGTPEYMAPEQARGVSRVTPGADQYSIGVVLYRALSGQTPYEATSFIELIHEVASGAGIPLIQAKPELPTELSHIVDRALAHKPENRFASMTEFGRALLPFASESGQNEWRSTF